MTVEAPSRAHQFSTLNEKALHAALKQWYAQPGDQFEVVVERSVIDIVRGDLLIEIQTGGFTPLRRKLTRLTANHHVRLIYPIAAEKYIVREDARGRISRRRSPKRGAVHDVFCQLVSFPKLLCLPNFTLEVLLIQEEEVRRRDGSRRAWRRRGWVTQERRLLGVKDRHVFHTPEDLAAFIPASLREPFTTADIAAATHIPRWIVQKMTYCLREAGVLDVVGKQGNSLEYARRNEQ